MSKDQTEMSGNPHVHEGPQVADAETINEEYIAVAGVTDETMALSELTRNTEATLALAYEQRTANLISYVTTIDDSSPAPLLDAIASRLGLSGAQK